VKRIAFGMTARCPSAVLIIVALGRNILDPPFQAIHGNDIAQLEGLVDQDQYAGEKILQNVLECKTNRYAADPEHFNEVARME